MEKARDRLRCLSLAGNSYFTIVSPPFSQIFELLEFAAQPLLEL